MNEPNFNYEKHAYCYIDIDPQDLSHGAYIHLKRISELIKDLPQNASLLDYGCGAGAITRAIKKLRPDLNLYGIDLSQTAIDQAKSASGQINFEVIKSDKLAFPDNFFDCVVMLEVLEHVPNPTQTLQEIKRVLKPNAKYFLAVPQEKSLLTLQGILIKLFKFYPSHGTAGHLHFWSQKELESLLQQNSFNIISKNYSQHYLWQIIGMTYMLLLLLTKKQTQELSQHISLKKSLLSTITQFCIKLLILATNLESIMLKKSPHGLDIQLVCQIQK